MPDIRSVCNVCQGSIQVMVNGRWGHVLLPLKPHDAVPCPFCEIVADREPHEVVQTFPDTLVIKPLREAIPGHVMAFPKKHVMNAIHDPDVTVRTYRDAFKYVEYRSVGPCNVITSLGKQATQSVFHLHIHILPRGPGDGVSERWPWTETETPVSRVDAQERAE